MKGYVRGKGTSNLYTAQNLQHWERRRFSLLLKVARAGAGCLWVIGPRKCVLVCWLLAAAYSLKKRSSWPHLLPVPSIVIQQHSAQSVNMTTCSLNISIYLQDNRVLEVQGCWQHSEGLQAQHPDRYRLQGSCISPQLLLQIHLLQKGSYLSSLPANWTRAITLARANNFSIIEQSNCLHLLTSPLWNINVTAASRAWQWMTACRLWNIRHSDVCRVSRESAPTGWASTPPRRSRTSARRICRRWARCWATRSSSSGPSPPCWTWWCSARWASWSWWTRSTPAPCATSWRPTARTWWASSTEWRTGAGGTTGTTPPGRRWTWTLTSPR